MGTATSLLETWDWHFGTWVGTPATAGICRDHYFTTRSSGTVLDLCQILWWLTVQHCMSKTMYNTWWLQCTALEARNSAQNHISTLDSVDITNAQRCRTVRDQKPSEAHKRDVPRHPSPPTPIPTTASYTHPHMFIALHSSNGTRPSAFLPTSACTRGSVDATSARTDAYLSTNSLHLSGLSFPQTRPDGLLLLPLLPPAAATRR